ncbi:Hypothetical predicted protein [Lecanosticta acicola]|uniref:Uncharacterized protein n=1 Tax=Lecanosticta acicola TaxID=111012 RepID=A0AAI8YVY5_9PEZI|nr:Hypothetical predicted protein [Lecanosticta acicola]
MYDLTVHLPIIINVVRAGSSSRDADLHADAIGKSLFNEQSGKSRDAPVCVDEKRIPGHWVGFENIADSDTVSEQKGQIDDDDDDDDFM